MSDTGFHERPLLPQLHHLQTGRCLAAQGRPSQKGGLVVLKACDYSDPSQVSPRAPSTGPLSPVRLTPGTWFSDAILSGVGSL